MNDAFIEPRTVPCPFEVGDRIHELRCCGYNLSLGPSAEQPFIDEPLLTLDDCRPDATVTALTERGFKYRYDCRVPIGRAQWGTYTEGGECFEAGFLYWHRL